MNNKKSFTKSLELIKQWEKALSNYTSEELEKKPNEAQWSLGQVYQHLIQATNGYHLGQIKTCLNTNENASKKKNFKGIMTYHILGKFPPIKIKVPPSETYTPKQPKSKEALREGLELARKNIEAIYPAIEANQNKGKTPHPGFAFLNAEEWFGLIPMHFKHHLRQKAELDKFLGK